LIFFCTQAWSQYPLGDQEKWPKDRTLNYNTILQLDLFCKREGKWTEILYMQLFFLLKEHHQWVKQYKGGGQTLTMACKNAPKEGDTSKTPPVAPKRATPSLLPKANEEGGHPTPWLPCLLTQQPLAAIPSNQFPGEEAAIWKRIRVPFRLSDLKESKWNLCSFINDPDQYIQPVLLLSKLLNWLGKMSCCK
jgi:hypothetical protein